MNQQEALVKLAQVRMAINYVLRQRGLTKQAERNFFDPRNFNENGERTLYGWFHGAPPRKPVVTPITGNDPGTKNTYRVDIPGYPNRTMYFNPASDQRHATDTSDIDKNAFGAAMASGTVGAGVGSAAGPIGAVGGFGLGTMLGLVGGYPAAAIKHWRNEAYRRDMRNSLKAQGYDVDMSFGPK